MAVAQTMLALSSPAFRDGDAMPIRFTCDGQNISPPLAWEHVPDGVMSFALILDDPDAPRGAFTHWVVYDLPKHTRGLSEGLPHTERLTTLGDAMQGLNDGGKPGYTGPCPPRSDPAHHYVFHLYALDRRLGLTLGATKDDVRAAIPGHVLAQGELVGRYARPT